MIDYGDSYLKGKDITFLFIIKTFSGFEADGGSDGVRAARADGGVRAARADGGSGGCEPHGLMMGGMGMVGIVGGVGIMGAVGGVKRGKLCQNLGTLTKFIIF